MGDAAAAVATGTLHKSYFDVLGICCPSEVPLVEKLLRPLPGVRTVTVIVPSRTVIVLHDAAATSPAQIGTPRHGHGHALPFSLSSSCSPTTDRRSVSASPRHATRAGVCLLARPYLFAAGDAAGPPDWDYCYLVLVPPGRSPLPPPTPPAHTADERRY